MYDSSQEYTPSFNVDIFTHAENPGDYSIIGEVKNLDAKKFSKEEWKNFLVKFEAIKKMEKLDRITGFIFPGVDVHKILDTT